MKNIFRFLFAVVYLSATALSASSGSLVSLNDITNEAQEDFCEIFNQLKEMNVVPQELCLNGSNFAKNGPVLLKFLETVQQNPDFGPQKNQYTHNLIQKLDQISYIELRQAISQFKKKNSFNIQDKARVLTTLHEMYAFQDPNSTTQNPIYPFRSEIVNIFLNKSAINNSSFSYEKRNSMFGLFMDNKYHVLLKIKESYPNCSIKSDDILTMIINLKAFIIQKSVLKKVLIGTAVVVGSVAVTALIVWLIYKYVWPKIVALKTKAVELKAKIEALQRVTGIKIISTPEEATAILNTSTDAEIGVKTGLTREGILARTPEEKLLLANEIVVNRRVKTLVQNVTDGALGVREGVTREQAMTMLSKALVNGAINTETITTEEQAMHILNEASLLDLKVQTVADKNDLIAHLAPEAKIAMAQDIARSHATANVIEPVLYHWINQLYTSMEGATVGGLGLKLIGKPVRIPGEKPVINPFRNVKPTSAEVTQYFADLVQWNIDHPTDKVSEYVRVPAAEGTFTYCYYARPATPEKIRDLVVANEDKQALLNEEIQKIIDLQNMPGNRGVIYTPAN